MKIKENPLKTALVHGFTTKTDIRVITNGKIDMLSSYLMRLTHLINDDTIKEEIETVVNNEYDYSASSAPLLSFILAIRSRMALGASTLGASGCSSQVAA